MTNHLLAALYSECVDALNQNGQMTVERLYDSLHHFSGAELCLTDVYR